MIVVKVELHSAITGKVSELGRMHISNDGKTTKEDPNRGTYRVEILRKWSLDTVQKETHVTNWPRKSRTIWELVHKGLDNFFG